MSASKAKKIPARIAKHSELSTCLLSSQHHRATYIDEKRNNWENNFFKARRWDCNFLLFCLNFGFHSSVERRKNFLLASLHKLFNISKEGERNALNKLWKEKLSSYECNFYQAKQEQETERVRQRRQTVFWTKTEKPTRQAWLNLASTTSKWICQFWVPLPQITKFQLSHSMQCHKLLWRDFKKSKQMFEATRHVPLTSSTHNSCATRFALTAKANESLCRSDNKNWAEIKI